MKRRQLLKSGTLVLLLGTQQIARGAEILAVRVWPAQDYSRVTIESDTPLATKHFLISNPPRMVVDIADMELDVALKELVAKVAANDPNIASIRVAQKTPDVVRLVIDLKHAFVPQVFNLPPIVSYQHRLVFDLYPTQVADPLAPLISGRLKGSPAPTPVPVPAPVNIGHDPLGELIAKKTTKTVETSAPIATKKEALYARQQTITAQKSIKNTKNSKPQAKPKTDNTDRLIIIAIDAGHGGEDPGAIGPGGTREKDVVLQLAHRLRERVNATTLHGNTFRAYLTRDADYFVPLHVRVQKAQKVQADLFVSIHADAFFTPYPQGASVFALSQKGASSAAAVWMADQENQADHVGGLSLMEKDAQVQHAAAGKRPAAAANERIGLNLKDKDAQVKRALYDMSTAAQINDSLKLGDAILDEIGQVGKLHKPQVEQASFAVLKAPDIPSVLVEAAFISNPAEEAKLNSPAYQIQLADALMRGIESYFLKNPPLARKRTA